MALSSTRDPIFDNEPLDDSAEAFRPVLAERRIVGGRMTLRRQGEENQKPCQRQPAQENSRSVDDDSPSSVSSAKRADYASGIMLLSLSLRASTVP